MTVVFDLYVPGTSWLHRLDPRVKLWGTILGFALPFILPDLASQAMFLIAIHVVLLTASIPRRAIGRFWRQMAILIVLILVLQPFLRPSGKVLFTVGPLKLTVDGLHDAARLALRALGIAFVTAALLLTTEQPALIQALLRLGLPYTWGLTISLALRFLPALQGLFRTVRDAQSARGWTLEGNPVRRLRAYIPVLVAVLIGTLRMSDQLTLALASRGLETMKTRTTWRPLRMGTLDWAILIAMTLGFAGLVWVRATLWGR
ncbi:MAG: energy-coupling factor transporter transmembrane component T family protein [Anaerolineae bacterium]